MDETYSLKMLVGGSLSIHSHTYKHTYVVLQHKKCGCIGMSEVLMAHTDTLEKEVCIILL